MGKNIHYKRIPGAFPSPGTTSNISKGPALALPHGDGSAAAGPARRSCHGAGAAWHSFSSGAVIAHGDEMKSVCPQTLACGSVTAHLGKTAVASGAAAASLPPRIFNCGSLWH